MQEPLYVNQVVGPDHMELQGKLERTRLKAAEVN